MSWTNAIPLPERPTLRSGDTVVVKLGSSAVTLPTGALDIESIVAFAAEIAQLCSSGIRPVVVTSGAVAAGVGMGILPRSHLSNGQPTNGDDRQAVAALGQPRLMQTYEHALGGHGILSAELLLSTHYFRSRKVHQSSQRTIERLLDLGVIPIINENDSVPADINTWSSENDRLAALVASMLNAQLLLLLTDQPGLYDDDPRLNPEARLVTLIQEIDHDTRRVAGGPASTVGTGGMATKIAAAEIASWSGIDCIIAQSSSPGVMADATQGKDIGTYVAKRGLVRTHERPLRSREVFIAFAAPVRGRLVIDAGAIDALRGRKRRSLLAVGVQSISGTFDAEDCVYVHSEDGELVAKGLASEGSDALQRMVDDRVRSTVVIHADDLLLLSPDKVGPRALGLDIGQ